MSRYHSIRIDSVHYCELEAVLAERRKRRSSIFDRNGEPEDPAQARLKLLCRTLREDPVRRGQLVQFLKMPYMLREACQADIARTIAVTPNLRYVDLPEGLFADEPGCMTLRLEVQARCLDLRKMTYMRGAENSLQALATGRVWTKLEVLELIRIDMEPSMLRQVLGCLSNLRALKISETESITDETLIWSDTLPPFPPLEEFILTKVPNITAEGLKEWLILPEARQSLRVLTLNSTGVKVWDLPELVGYTPNLKHLSISDSVATTLQTAAGPQNIRLLNCTNLESLHYEITAAPSAPKFSGATASYYQYLANSLLSGGLPNLRALYVRDPHFPDLLLGLPPPAPAYAEGRVARPASSGSAFPSYQSNNRGSLGLPLPPAPSGGHGSGHRPHGSLSTINGLSGSSSTNKLPTSRINHRFSSNNPFASLAAQQQQQQQQQQQRRRQEELIRGLPLPPFAPSATGTVPAFINLPSKLEVFTKGDDDQLGWSFVQVGYGDYWGGGGRHAGDAYTLGAASRSERPLSSYGLGADVLGGNISGWSSGAGARRSVLVAGGGAGGGFTAVADTGAVRKRTEGGFLSPIQSPVGPLSPRKGSFSGSGDEDSWPRPKSSSGEKKRERMDLWR